MIPKTFLLASAVATLAIAIPAYASGFEKIEHATPGKSSARRDNGTHISVEPVMVPSYIDSLPFSVGMEIVMDVIHRYAPLLPIEALALPAYANWTDHGWNLRMSGNVYRMLNVTEHEVDLIANEMLRGGGASMDRLPEPEQMQMRNFSRTAFTFPWKEVDVRMVIVDDASVDNETDRSAIGATGGAQTIDIPYRTTRAGNFGSSLYLMNTTGSAGGHLRPGRVSGPNWTPEIKEPRVQVLNMHVDGLDNSQTEAYLVPRYGVTILSSVESLMNVEGDLGSALTKSFTPWMNMADVYANWSASFHSLHFHYMTKRPSTVARNYLEFLSQQKYPRGSFDAPEAKLPSEMRSMSGNQSTVSHPRKALLETVLQSFPKRRIILVGDASDKELMELYSQLYRQHYYQMSCIFIRMGPQSSPDLSSFVGLPRHSIVFFNEPNDLRHVDVGHGRCTNPTVERKIPFIHDGYHINGSKEEGAAASVALSREGAAGRVALSRVGALIVACAMAMVAGFV